MFSILPLDIIYYVLSYDRRFVIRNGKLIQINKINKNKYAFLMDIPKIKIDDGIPEVVLKIKNSNYFFCLMYNDSFELQKLEYNNGITYFLDSIS